MHKLALFCALVISSAPAMAVYKCEAGGKVTYSDVPCPGGQLIDVPVPARAAAADAMNQAAREKGELRRLQDERRKQEQLEAAEQRERARMAKASASREKKCKSLAMHRKWSEEDAAAANLKSVEKARRNARRKAEKFELECGNT